MNRIEVPALALTQSPGRTIYAFGIDGKLVPSFTSVSRIGREEQGHLIGYQRPEVRRHISDIRSYIESECPMVPNAVVIAFDERVSFTSLNLSEANGRAVVGTLRIPLAGGNDTGPVGWVVDGQQRIAAIRDANVEHFPVFAVAFVAHDEAEQREQFLLVNNTKPLARGLIYELLPGVGTHLPPHLARRRLPTILVDVLNADEDSPLYQAVSRPTNPAGRLKDNSLIKMIENSLTDGVLYRYRMVSRDESEIEGMTEILVSFWSAVQKVWDPIWELGPRKSRLLHGAGVVSLGFLMDAMSDRVRDGWPDQELFETELSKIAPDCRWNEGYWEFGGGIRRRWDEIQNVSKDVQLLSNHLLRLYLRTRRTEE